MNRITATELIKDSVLYYKKYFTSLFIPSFAVIFLLTFLDTGYMDELFRIMELGGSLNELSKETRFYLLAVPVVQLLLSRFLIQASSDFSLGAESLPPAEDIFKGLMTFIFLNLLIFLGTVIGILFLVLPGMIWLLFSSLAPVIQVVEEKNITDSFKISLLMMKDHWAAAAAVYVSVYLVFILLSGFESVFYSDTASFRLGAVIFRSLLSSLFISFGISARNVLYYTIRNRQDLYISENSGESQEN